MIIPNEFTNLILHALDSYYSEDIKEMGKKCQSSLPRLVYASPLSNSLPRWVSRSGIDRILYKSGNVQCVWQPSYFNCQILNISAKICVVKSHYNLHRA